MKLTEIHTLFRDSILTSEPLINPYLDSPPKGSIADRVAIYVDGFYARLEEALMSDYSTLAAIVGENLSQFLTETLPYKKKPHLAEIAEFEWSEYQAIGARDANLLSVFDLQSLPLHQWPEMKFNLHPSCKILIMHRSTLYLIKALRSNKSIPTSTKLKSPQFMLIWRRQLDVLYRKLESPELTMLNAIMQEAPFMDICEILSHQMPEDKVATYAVRELHAWIQQNCLINNS